MGDELLDMLASETDRRAPPLLDGLEDLASNERADPDAVERLRVEAHGLKGAAMVVGQARLAELGERVEVALANRIAPGTIDPGLAERMSAAVSALRDGARAASKGDPEPASVEAALTALRAKPNSGSRP